MLRPTIIIAAVLALVVTDRPACGLIKVSMPVSKTYEQADLVLVGMIQQINNDNRVLDIKLTSAVKGQMYSDRFRVQLAAPPGLISQVATSQPVVVFASDAGGRSVAAVHLADRWLLADRVANISPPVWRVNQLYTDLKQSFPGRTSALVRVVESIKAGRGEMLNEINVNLLGTARPAGRLPVADATGFISADIDGDGANDIVVAVGGQFRLFISTAADEYRDASADWGGPWPAPATLLAAADVNGDDNVDLLLGTDLLINRGKRFDPAPLAGDKIAPDSLLAVSMADCNSDGRLDVAFVSKDGQLSVRLNPGRKGGQWEVGPQRRLWPADAAEVAAFAAVGDFGDDGSAAVLVVRESGPVRYSLVVDRDPDDFELMTGLNLPKYYQRYRNGLKQPRAAIIDANGDGRADLLVACTSGTLFMANRGFGVFLVDYDAAGAFKNVNNSKGQITITDKWHMAAGEANDKGMQELLLLDSQGRLFRIR